MKKSKTILLIILISIIAVIIGYVIYNINNNTKNENIKNSTINQIQKSENTENNPIINDLSLKLEMNTQKQENESEIENKMSKLNIKVENKNYTATLYDNETTRALLKEMPLTVNMSELHGNEKYYYFNHSFPTKSERITNIKTGDIMLFGAECLVLFYEDFSTSYSYTKIGHIDNPENLSNVLGTGSVQVTFEED